ncbi:MAG: peptidoglycan-binding protein [Eubacterium sp.]|nr:peptidoglycan-binding protein [Eubacterium sp.]
MSKKIIDIYHDDTITTYDEVCEATYFIILKGSQGMHMVDDKCKARVEAFEKHGHPYWIYVFLDKGRELEQTKRLVELYKDVIGKYFIGYCIDIEEENSQSGCLEALDYLLELPHKAMFYFAWDSVRLYPRLISRRSDQCAFWECRYGDSAGNHKGTDRSDRYPFHSFADLCQYTEYGHCKGIEGYVDLNRISGHGKDLEWFMTPMGEETSDDSSHDSSDDGEREPYSGTLPALPPRGYYMLGDGKTQYNNYSTQIKRLQEFLNWALDRGLTVDGIIGRETREAIIDFEIMKGLTPDGFFGEKCLKAARKMKK